MQTIRRLACLTVVSASLILYPAAANAQTVDQRDLDAFVARALKEYRVPGAAVAVVKDGRVVFAKGFGVRDVNTSTDLVALQGVRVNPATDHR